MGLRTLTLNMAIWQIEYFKLKELEKWQVVGRTPYLLPRAGHRPPCESCPRCAWWKRALSLKRQRGAGRNLNEETSPSTPSSCPLSGDFPLLVRPRLERARLYHLVGLRFLMKAVLAQNTDMRYVCPFFSRLFAFCQSAS